MKCGLALSTTPSAICVGTTGARNAAASCATSACAWLSTTPPPATSNGRFASHSSAVASSIDERDGRGPTSER